MSSAVLLGDTFGPINDTADLRVIMDPAAIHAFMADRNGPVMRDLTVRATRVQEAASKQVRLGHVGGGEAMGGFAKSAPKARANLRYSIVKRVIEGSDGMPSILVGSDNPIALLHHEGTKPHIIRPRNAKILAFWAGGSLVFRHVVHHPGTQPNRYLTDNLHLAI